MTDIVLVEDHELVREGIVRLLNAESTLRVVGTGGSGTDVVPLVEKHRPDVLVVDLSLPDLDGLEALRRASRVQPQLRIVVLSMHRDPRYVREALDSGASAYVLKDASANHLKAAIASAMSGRLYTSPGLEVPARRARRDSGDRFDLLTAREREIVHLVAEGQTSPGIADHLSLSARTVETHRANAMAKLGVAGRDELVRLVLSRGLTPAPK